MSLCLHMRPLNHAGAHRVPHLVFYVCFYPLPHSPYIHLNYCKWTRCMSFFSYPPPHPHPPPLKLARRTVLWSDKKIKMKQQPKNVGLRRREDPAAARYAPPPDALQMFFFFFFYARCPCDLVWLWFFWVYPLGEAELLKHSRSTVEKKERVTALRVSLQTTWIWFKDILKKLRVIFIFM